MNTIRRVYGSFPSPPIRVATQPRFSSECLGVGGIKRQQGGECLK